MSDLTLIAGLMQQTTDKMRGLRGDIAGLTALSIRLDDRMNMTLTEVRAMNALEASL